MFDLKKWWSNYLWTKAVKQKYGFGPEHLQVSHNLWSFATWNKDDVPYIVEAQARSDENPKVAIGDSNKFLHNLDKIWKEISETSKNTIVKPIQTQLINGLPIPKILTYQQRHNILTNDGMADMGKNRTSESAKANTHHAIGTGTTAETVSDHVTYSGTLETEQARKAIGTRSVVNQTERYGTAFLDTDITVPKSITEAGILTGASSEILVLRVTAAAQVLDTAQIMTVQTNVTHLNGTET